jgi:transposase-like protein
LAKINKKEALMKRALELHEQGYMQVSISRELDVHPSTLRRWFRAAGIKPIKREEGEPKPEDTDPLQSAINEKLNIATGEAAKLEAHDARLAENEDIMNLAEAQTSPGDKYQSYVAATCIKLLRDSMKNLRGPRTVKELAELDQLIRRNLGLNSKNGGTGGHMQIDISILNNTKADKGRGAVEIKSKRVVDIEPLDEEN